MKKNTLLLFIFFTIYTAYSQVDRSIGPSQYKNSKSSNKIEKKDPVEASLTYLKKELNLDSFQEAAAKVYLTENQTSAEKILNSDISNEEKKLKFEEAVEEFDLKFTQILNPEQIKIFEGLKEKKKSKKKDKTKKKKEEEN